MTILPKVSILIVTYLEQNQKYLDLCLKSILNLDYPKDLLDVLVLSSGYYEPNTMGFRHIHSSGRLHYPEGVNYGVKHLEKDSKHLLLLNDDVILSKDSLKNMVISMGEQKAIMGPISNCDNYWKYALTMAYEENGKFVPLTKRFYRYEESCLFAEKIMNTKSLYNLGAWKQNFICFYATLIPRVVWDEVGELDPKFETGCDDLDYCLRCKQKNIPVLIEQSSFIFHHGGTSADVALTKDNRSHNDNYFTKKWGVSPYAFH